MHQDIQKAEKKTEIENSYESYIPKNTLPVTRLVEEEESTLTPLLFS